GNYFSSWWGFVCVTWYSVPASSSKVRARTLLHTANCRYFTLRLRLGASCVRIRNSRAHLRCIAEEGIINLAVYGLPTACGGPCCHRFDLLDRAISAAFPAKPQQQLSAAQPLSRCEPPPSQLP